MKKYDEDILVFPTARLYEIGYFEGFRAQDKRFHNDLFSVDSRFQFLDRNLAETDPSFKQIIPYVTVRCGPDVLTARRSKKVGESRLAGLRTTSLGGHVNTTDVDGETNLDPLALFTKGLVREINEELKFEGDIIPKWELYGYINDVSNEVGLVHFGASYLIEVSSRGEASIIDEGLIDHEWIPSTELASRLDEFEGWSQIIIKNVYGFRH